MNDTTLFDTSETFEPPYELPDRELDTPYELPEKEVDNLLEWYEGWGDDLNRMPTEDDLRRQPEVV